MIRTLLIIPIQFIIMVIACLYINANSLSFLNATG
jgi:hypothetical protein